MAKGTSTLMRMTALLTVWLVAGTSNSVPAADFWSEPIFIASISVPLGAIPDNTAASPRFMLTITGRSVQSSDEERQLLELSAPIATPSSLSLNGHPVFRSTGYNTAESTDRELTTEETFATVAIVGLAIAGAAGVVIIDSN